MSDADTLRHAALIAVAIAAMPLTAGALGWLLHDGEDET